MKAMVIDKFEGIGALHEVDLPVPTPQSNEIQIEVVAAGVNPVDYKIADGLLANRMKYEFPITLGWDVSGIITSVGAAVKNLKAGDEIFAYCRKSKIKDGSFAEYICLEADHVALKPPNLSFIEAASIPLTGLTAWQGLFDIANLKKGESVLIHAGAGGVGGLAIQFAKSIGAKILTTATAKNHDYVKQLGADFAIDYTQVNFVKEVKSWFPQGVDVVLATIGGKTLEESYTILRAGGRLVSIVEPVNEKLALQNKVKAHYLFVSPSGSELAQIGQLIGKGKVIPPIIEEVPFNQATQALEKVRSGHIKGKVVLRVKDV